MQIRNTVSAAGGSILRAVGLPDLHQGPTGVAILAKSPMPKLPGYDIGCGMALFATRIPASIARDRVARCLTRMDLDEGEHADDPHLGTIGAGNHFAELLVIDGAVPLADEMRPLMDPDRAVLLVHSGSRGHGSRVYSEHADGHDLEGYMREHERLVAWAARNRAEIARRFLRQFAGGGGAAEDDQTGEEQPSALIDIAHNWIERLPDGSFLHRKGAAPSHAGSLSLLPGSRATASYVLVGDGLMARDLGSVAHGAGRRMSRADARRCGAASDDLTRGGTVVCESKELLLEEAPHAYKDVEAVVSCMVQRSMCRVGARLIPIATYKTRNPDAGH